MVLFCCIICIAFTVCSLMIINNTNNKSEIITNSGNKKMDDKNKIKTANKCIVSVVSKRILLMPAWDDYGFVCTHILLPDMLSTCSHSFNSQLVSLVTSFCRATSNLQNGGKGFVIWAFSLWDTVTKRKIKLFLIKIFQVKFHFFYYFKASGLEN